ncbi:hypothetical protein OHA21_17275 [Actinoplanes sp. NBC_00393]|uniref:hypothetical protein n=1 Tax=Actinoplanes sp. NBC_00393 TaxID=2975953 RepID=UPI002E1F07A5
MINYEGARLVTDLGFTVRRRAMADIRPLRPSGRWAGLGHQPRRRRRQGGWPTTMTWRHHATDVNGQFPVRRRRRKS